MKMKLLLSSLFLVFSLPLSAFEIGLVGFQMSSETHARVINAAEARARELGWEVTVLNSGGNLATHAEQIENLRQKPVDAMILAMSKPVEFDAYLEEAKKAGIPVITVMSGNSAHVLFDIQVNEYAVGAEAALYLLGTFNYDGNILSARFESNVGTRIRGSMLDAVLDENTGIDVIGSFTMARTQSWQDDVRGSMNALILQNIDNFDAVWASFDGQAFIIDDLLLEHGFKKGDVALVSIDGGEETYRRIKDPQSMMTATVAIPFEQMGQTAVEAIKRIVLDGEKRENITTGPYLFQDAVLVDQHNVDDFIK